MGAPRGERHGNWRGGRRIDRDGYVWIYAPDHPKAHEGAYLEHRIVMEQSVGRSLDSLEHVHHINGDRQDNRLENLELLSASDHAKEHELGIKGRGRTLSQETKDKIAAGHLGGTKSSRGRPKVGANLEASRRNIEIARQARLARKKPSTP